jgi:hypothetical protein
MMTDGRAAYSHCREDRDVADPAGGAAATADDSADAVAAGGGRSQCGVIFSKEGHPDRHSGAPQSGEPGIHNHDREYGFRACAKRRIPE